MAALTKETPVGFIGTGVMGKSMAGHILAAGYPLLVFTRTTAKADALVARGARLCESTAELAQSSRVIITMVGFPTDVDQVYFGDKGILAHAARGAYLIDMTTSSPDMAKRIYEEARGRDMMALDAPVSGGDRGAREAKLSIMVGGDPDAFEAVRPLLQCMGANIVLFGPAGSGQHMKMANQLAVAPTMLGVCEALAYAKCAGLDPQRALDLMNGGAAASWALANYGPRILARDFEPGFFVKHLVKDMRIALESAQRMGLQTPGLAAARAAYERLVRHGGADLGTHGLYKLYDPTA